MSLHDSTATPASATFREVFKGDLNISNDQLIKQMRSNIRRPLPQVMMHPPNDYKVALLCGGPSLNDNVSAIKRMVSRGGYKIATVNNTYNWALEHGLRPGVYVQHDARESNARFVQEPIDTCKYMLCSQVHPVMFDALRNNNVHIWHAGGPTAQKMFDRYYMKRWLKVPGGTTIGTRALFLLYTLGVRTVRIYGMDSSYGKKRAHHAYEQKENDGQEVMTVTVGRRKFKSTPWMVAQLDEVLQLAGSVPADLKVSFEGDGLLQYVINETSKRGVVPKMKLEKI